MTIRLSESKRCIFLSGGTSRATDGCGNTTTTSIGAANLAPLFVPYRMPTSESYRSLTPLNMSSQSPIIANESGSRMKESLSSTEEQRTGIELDSLPLDGQPVSISQIHLEHVSSEETDE